MKGSVMIVCLIALVSTIGVPAEAAGVKKVGMLLWNDAPRWVDTKNGIQDQLKKEGFEEPALKFFVVNAGGSKAKAMEAVHKFAVDGMDLIIPFGTSATLAVARDIRDVPVVFSYVYDPVEAKIAKGSKGSDNNTTGVSNRIPLSTVLSKLEAFAQVRRLAVLYSPYAKNSELQLKELQELQADFRIKVVPVPLTAVEDVPQLLPEVMRRVDALYLTGCDVVDKTATRIADMANKARVVTVTHIDGLVNQGVLLGVTADSYAVGLLTGKMAAKVLRGKKPSSIPIEYLKKLAVTINMRSARVGGFRIAPSFMTSATKVIE